MVTIKEHKFHYPKSAGRTASGMEIGSEPNSPCGRCGGEICRRYDKASGLSCRLLVHPKGDHANDRGSWSNG